MLHLLVIFCLMLEYQTTTSLIFQGNLLSTEDLRDLFSFHGDVRYVFLLNSGNVLCPLRHGYSIHSLGTDFTTQDYTHSNGLSQSLFPGNVTRSEIHEKMSCIRCQNDAFGTVNIEEGNENNVDDNACQIDQEDIGGFAKDAGCLNLLKNSERQVHSCACY